jgi:hypothetical protein
VFGSSLWFTGEPSVTYTNFTGAIPGAKFTLVDIYHTAVVVQNNANIITMDGSDLTLSPGVSTTFLYTEGAWREVSRTNNAIARMCLGYPSACSFQYTQKYSSFPATFTNSGADFPWMLQNSGGSNIFGIAGQTTNPSIFLVTNTSYDMALGTNGAVALTISSASNTAYVNSITFANLSLIASPVNGMLRYLLPHTGWPSCSRYSIETFH